MAEKKSVYPTKKLKMDTPGRRQLKKKIITVLEGNWQEEKETLLQYPLKSLLNPLFIALCHPVELVRWHAVEAFSHVVPRLAEENVEEARIVMRRFLWSLNDESGGIGWGAPEAMAAIMCESEILRKEYLHMLISYMEDDGPELFQDGNFLELPMLQRGLLWGVGLLCFRFPELMKSKGVEADLLLYLDSSDGEVAARALWALSGLGVRLPLAKLEPFLVSKECVSLFCDSAMQRYSVADIAGRLKM